MAYTGAVISYDIITGWNPIQLYDQFVTSVIVSIKSLQCRMVFSFVI